MPDRVAQASRCAGPTANMDGMVRPRTPCTAFFRVRDTIRPSNASVAPFQLIIAVESNVRDAPALPVSNTTTLAEYDLKKYMCLICGWVYDEATGAPDEGIAAGTKWEDVPPNWTCPECGARKEDFEMIEL